MTLNLGTMLMTMLMVTAAGTDRDPAPQLTAARRQAIEEGVEKALATYRERAAAGDWEGVLALYADDPGFRWITNGAIAAHSVTELRKGLLGLPPGSRAENTYRDTEILPLAPDLALVSTTFETKVVDASGKSFSFGGKLSMVLVARKEGWLILHGHASAPVERTH
jgi:ketosteroid isomerase-like protein